MYKEDIRELKKQKREAMRDILFDFASIYFRMKLFFPNLKQERENLVVLVQQYVNADHNENEVLALIQRRFGNLDDHEDVDELLEEFDDRFENLYYFCQATFEDYETVLSDYWDYIALINMRLQSLLEGERYAPAEDTKYRMHHRKMNFSVFDEDYKKKMLEMIPQLPAVKEEMF